MHDVETVIRGLECCLPPHDPNCDLCPYDSIDLRCRANLCDDVMALLKAQDPRVMTLDEVKAASENGEPVCVETADGEVCWALTYPGIEPPKEGFNYPGGVLFDAVDVNDEIYDGDFYNMTMPDGRPHGLAWRAWTSRPTDEQREATPWE